MDRQTYVTREEAAQLLSCSLATIDRYRRGGKLRSYTGANGHSVWLRRTAVEELAEPVVKG